MPKMNYSKFRVLPFEERFWNKVQKTKTCWLWKAGKSGMGYGQLGINWKVVYAHRVSYEMAYGKIPKGKLILHECDMPSCVRPTHLSLGTHSKNLLEAYARGLHKMSAGGKYAKSKVARNSQTVKAKDNDIGRPRFRKELLRS